MSESKGIKKSPLVQTVTALDSFFEELERVGTKINTMDLKTDSDYEQARRLLKRFAECGEGVTVEIGNLSKLLLEARQRAEAISADVEARAAMVGERRDENAAQMDAFNALTAKVRELGADLSQLKREEGEELTDENREAIARRLSEVHARLNPLIEEAKRLHKEARVARMKTLEQSADSLAQTLLSLQSKITSLDLPTTVVQ